MKINELSIEAALVALGTTASGLDAGEVSRKLHQFGRNEIQRVSRTSATVRLLREFVQFFSVILWLAAALAFIAEWSAPGEGMGRIGAALVACILVSGLFSFWQENRVERTLNALLKLLPR
jgi:sodium/potassium-transporting ATPase subunit alpha